MTYKSCYYISLHSACAPDKTEIRAQLKEAARYLARRAAEEDYWKDAEEPRAGCEPIDQKEFEP